MGHFRQTGTFCEREIANFLVYVWDCIWGCKLTIRVKMLL